MLIGLESNLLHGRVDPEAISEIKPLLSLAKKIGAPVKIPEPCLVEIREGYREKLQEAITELEDTRRNMAHLRISVEIPPIDEVAELAGYDERLKRFLQSHAIETIPFVDALPDRKALFESPFDAKGSNFRDAVICLSVSQFAKSLQTPVLLVTNDRGFRVVLKGDEGFEVLTIEDAVKRLDAELSDKDRARRAELNKRIAAVVRERFNEIAKIARSDAQSLLGDQIEFRNLTVTVEDLVPEEVLVEAAETSGPRTPFTATLKAQVHCTVRAKPFTAPFSFGGYRGYLPTLLGSDEVIEDKQVFPIRMTVEGEVTLDEKGNVQNIAFKPEVRGRAISVSDIALARAKALRKLFQKGSPKMAGQ